MIDDPAFASITELGGLLRSRASSSEELVAALIGRTRRLDQRLNSYITFVPDQALAAAREADAALRRGDDRGPLHGIPVSVKDHIATAGIPTSAGARFRLTNVPDEDAAVVRRLKSAGAVVMGKANMNKFAGGESGDNPDFGRIRTPWNTEFSAGGSSGGSGAMVSAGLVPLSIGSDNGGSIRIPAAVCGVVGLKPTFGRVSLDGVFPRAYTFDHVGPITRTVEDAAIVLQAIAGHDPDSESTIRRAVPDYRAALAAPLAGVRIGIDGEYSRVAMPAVLDRVTNALAVLEQLGASTREVRIPPFTEFDAVSYAMGPEFSVSLGGIWRDHPTEFSAEDTAWNAAGEMVPAVDYIRGQQRRRVLARQYASATREIDVLACPTYPFDRRPFGAWPELAGRAATFGDALRYTIPFDILGLPAISVPCGFSDDGFPIGLQLVGRAFEDGMILRVAHRYEQATEWHHRRPPI